MNPEAQVLWTELHDLINEYKLVDLSPNSMVDFTNRLQTDTDLAALYEWNMNRRGGNPSKLPKVKANNKKYKCMTTSER